MRRTWMQGKRERVRRYRRDRRWRVWGPGAVVSALLGALLALFAVPVWAAPAALRSPWDGLPVALTDAAYSCPAAPPFAKSLNVEGYYSDAHRSVVDPAREAAERAATAGPTHLGQWSTEAADAYRKTGSRQAAACVYSLLDAAAQAKAWTADMPTSQGSYEQKWMLAAVSVAYLKVRGSGVGTAQQTADIARWFGSLASQVIDYVERMEPHAGSDAWNNHRYWAGYAVAAAGIAVNRQADLHFGEQAYDVGVDQIQPDGALPLELARAGRALHYHLYAVAPLVLLANLAAVNGTDLYGRNHDGLARLVRLCVAGLADPGIFAKATGVPQEMPDRISGAVIGWAVPWVQRFPDAQLQAWIASATTTSFWQWGGLPPGAS